MKDMTYYNQYFDRVWEICGPMFEQGVSWEDMAAELNRRGILPHRAEEWTGTVLSEYIRSHHRRRGTRISLVRGWTEDARKKARANITRQAASFAGYIIPEIKALKEAGRSDGQIAEALNKKCLYTRKGMLWSAENVHFYYKKWNNKI